MTPSSCGLPGPVPYFCGPDSPFGGVPLAYLGQGCVCACSWDALPPMATVSQRVSTSLCVPMVPHPLQEPTAVCSRSQGA